MTSISKNMPINKLYDIVNKYKSTYSTIKMKSVDVKSSINIDFNKKINNEGPKYNVGGNVRKLKKLKLLCHVHILLVILKVNKFFEFL